MLSVRNDGASISEIVGIYLGNTMKTVMRIFSVILLVMVGVVFMVGPAGLLAKLTPSFANVTLWTIVILIYYFLATLLPIDKIIGKLYPIFGVCLIMMAVGIAGATIFNSGTRPMMEITLQNLHPDGAPIWPLMFITVACGAISGFHATQSPIISRCIDNEKNGRKIFYGAMVAEGIIALIWASAGIAFYKGTGGLLAVGGGNSSTVYEMSIGLLGKVGGVLAMIGVIACPITSGDTAFRSARLTIADAFNIKQDGLLSRFKLAIPLFAVCVFLTTIDFNIIWRYFAWSNQTLATIFLWTATVYLIKNEANYWISLIPATFMSSVCVSYILQAPEGFRLNAMFSNGVGVVAAIVLFVLFMLNKNKFVKNKDSKNIA